MHFRCISTNMARKILKCFLRSIKCKELRIKTLEYNLFLVSGLSFLVMYLKSEIVVLVQHLLFLETCWLILCSIYSNAFYTKMHPNF